MGRSRSILQKSGPLASNARVQAGRSQRKTDIKNSSLRRSSRLAHRGELIINGSAPRVTPTSLRASLRHFHTLALVNIGSRANNVIASALRTELATPLTTTHIRKLHIIDSAGAAPFEWFNGRPLPNLHTLQVHFNVHKIRVDDLMLKRDILRDMGTLLLAPQLVVLDLERISILRDNQELIIDALGRMSRLEKLTLKFEEFDGADDKVDPSYEFRSMRLADSLDQVHIQAALPELVIFLPVFVIPPHAKLTVSWACTSRVSSHNDTLSRLHCIKEWIAKHFEPIGQISFNNLIVETKFSSLGLIEGSFSFQKPQACGHDPDILLPPQFTLRYRFLLQTKNLTPKDEKRFSRNSLFEALLNTMPTFFAVEDLCFTGSWLLGKDRTTMIFRKTELVHSVRIDHPFPTSLLAALSSNPTTVLVRLRLIQLHRTNFTERNRNFIPLFHASESYDRDVEAALFQCLLARPLRVQISYSRVSPGFLDRLKSSLMSLERDGRFSVLRKSGEPLLAVIETVESSN